MLHCQSAVSVIGDSGVSFFGLCVADFFPLGDHYLSMYLYGSLYIGVLLDVSSSSSCLVD